MTTLTGQAAGFPCAASLFVGRLSDSQGTGAGYDGLGRQTAVTDALGHTVTTVYDKAGNVTRTVDAAGNTYTYTYDNLNRRVSVQDPGGGIATTVYDAAGNMVNTIDPLGNKGTFVYDALNRQTQATDARGGVTSYLYDALNNRTGLLDPDGNRTTFVFDALNRQTQETDPLNHSLTMAYDAADRLTSQTDRLGRRIDYAYDNASRLLTAGWRDNTGTAVNTLAYSYDNAGNQLTAADSHGTYTMGYDALNRESAVQGLFGVSLTFTYDGAGNRTKAQDSFGGVATSVFDAANRQTSEQFGGVGQTPLRFDTAYTARNQVGTLTRYSDLAGSTKVGESDYTYDSAGRLQNLQHKNGSGTSLANYTYTYDLASRVTSETLNGGSPTSYQYDNTNQLTNDGTRAYSYDLAGNRTMSGYVTGPDNQLTSDGVYSYSYDAEGNLTKKSKGASAETWTYTYDNRNQLVGVTERSTDGGGTLLFQGTYVYDVFNNRVEADEYTNGSGTTVTRSVYAVPGTVFADLTSGNAMQTRYLHQDGSQYSPVLARIDGSGAAWLLQDRLGSTRNVANASGTLVGTVTYGGFGDITSETSPANMGNYTYTGLTFLRNAGVLGANDRIYDPLTARWIQQDPKRFGAGDTNLDRYVGNNPTNATDPSGLDAYALTLESADDVTEYFRGKMGTIGKVDGIFPTPIALDFYEISGGRFLFVYKKSDKDAIRQAALAAKRRGEEWNWSVLSAIISDDKHVFVASRYGKRYQSPGDPWKHDLIASPIEEMKWSASDDFYFIAARNGVPFKLAQLMTTTARQVEIPLLVLPGQRHQKCYDWVEQYLNKLNTNLVRAGYWKGTLDASRGGIKRMNKKLWRAPRSHLIFFTVMEDHTALEVVFRDGSIVYIDIGTISTHDVRLLSGKSHFSRPSDIRWWVVIIARLPEGLGGQELAAAGKSGHLRRKPFAI